MVIKLSMPYDTNPPLLAAHRCKNQAAIADTREAIPTSRPQPEANKQSHARNSTFSSRTPRCAARATNHPSLGTKWLSKDSNASANLRAVPESKWVQSFRRERE